MSKHTKGPWFVDGYAVSAKLNKEYVFVADVHPFTAMKGFERKANANLIAASPELLEACESALLYCLDYQSAHSKINVAKDYQISDEIKKLKLAIQKAKGE